MVLTHSLKERGFRAAPSPFVLGLLAASFFSVGGDPRAAEPTAAPPEQPLSNESRATYEKHVLPFLHQHCWKCHDDKSAKAGFIVEGLGTDFLAGKTADHWRELVNKINLGKMPPKDEPRPDAKAAFRVVEWVNHELRNAEKRAQTTGGRVPMRRLNRTEYANTVRDLFHLDEEFARKLERELPADGKVDGFDRGGAALFIDKGQLQAYLDAARMVLDEALPAEKPKSDLFHHLAVKDTNLIHRVKKTTTMKEILEKNQFFSNIYSTIKPPAFAEIERGPEPYDFDIVRNGGVEVSVIAPFTGQHLNYLQRGPMPRKIVTKDGWYRVRLRAGADRGKGKLAVDDVRVRVQYCRGSKDYETTQEIVIDAPLDQPKVYERLIYLKYGGPNLEKVMTFTWNIYYPRRDTENPLVLDPELKKLFNDTGRYSNEYQRATEKKDKPEVVEALRQKREDYQERLRKFSESFKGPVYIVNPEVDLAALPRIWFEYVDLEGPITAEWPTAAHRDFFFRGDDDDGLDYARDIFTRFLPRAYRRPVKAEEVEAVVQVVKTMREKHGLSFQEAVRSAVLSVLTSADFLFLQEPTGADTKPRELTDFELASRLSYFLWSSMPDQELLNLAGRKELHGPEVLKAQVLRLAADPRARQFVENFVGQWMRVRDFDTVMVDARQYPAYDDKLRAASLREPYEFFHELLRSGLPITKVIDSDFLVVNQSLAKHYGIEGVEGESFRRVALKPEHRRGGILGMAGVLTYLSDGTRTQPVKRGAYVLDVLWNTPAPLPPPNAGDLPVFKGKKLTVRQRLEQHRSVDTCASCHAKIDPLGLALENYDAIGAWRERQNGEGRKGEKNDPPIDASGVMPDGKIYRSLPEFKQILLEDKDKFLKGFTEKLLAYALGRPIGATDTATVKQVLMDSARGDYRLPAVLQAIAINPAFRTK